jgi:predicted Zn finger-like uncharacterized protein
VVVICPKCKVKLKVDDAKLSPSGSRFKCPKCSAVLVVKKPAPPAETRKTLDTTKVLVAHSNPEILESARTVLNNHGYEVITATDGIDVMVKALREFPFLAVVEVSLPKIYGFEICKKLKSREETKEMKFILVPSIFDRSRYRREPSSLYGADDYIEAQDIPSLLLEKINKLAAIPEEGAGKPLPEEKKPLRSPETPQSTRTETAGIKTEATQPAAPAELKPSAEKTDEAVEKAKRLSRTIINDIYLYNSAKVTESIRNGNFYAVFESELREGQKLYDNRIPQAIRDSGNYYSDTIKEFLEKKKLEIS